MLKEHKITQAQCDEAIATPVTPNIVQPSTGCQTANPTRRRLLLRLRDAHREERPAFGDDRGPRWQNFQTGGYQIYTTLDLDLQTAAMNSMNDYMPQTYRQLDLGAALVTVQPGTGQILAMVQNKDFTTIPEVTRRTRRLGHQLQHRLRLRRLDRFPVGSTYKIFTLAEWLKTGHSLNERGQRKRAARFNLAQLQEQLRRAGRRHLQVANDGGPTRER